jgi:D-aspartate ligase
MIEPTACRADYQEGVAVANGYNIPYAMYCAAANLSPYQPRPARRPVLWVNGAADYQAALYYMSRKRLTRWQWLRSLRGPKSYAVWTRSDTGPYLELLRRKLAARLGRLKRQ